MEKSPEAFRTISEVADELDVPKHVLRFWEGKFAQLRPMKRGGGRRYYRPEDVDLLRGVRRLLYEEGYTIKGVQKILREQGVRRVMDLWRPEGGAEERAAGPHIPEVSADARRSAAEPPDREEGAGAGALTGRQIRQLQAVLEELEDCRRLLAAASG